MNVITDLLVTGNCAPTSVVECPLRSSSFACKRKLELESSGARSRENERLNGNNLSIVLTGGGCFDQVTGELELQLDKKII